MLLRGKTAFVTGGSRGIGKAIVLRFLEEGATVYFLSRRGSPHGKEMEAMAADKGVKVISLDGDVSDEKGIAPLLDEVLQESGGIDILVNNAGITRDKLFFSMTVEDWRRVMGVNLEGPFHITKKISRAMARKREGTIINISSIVGITGNAGQVNYAASKAGLIGFTKSLAKELASRNVRVNAIAPGFIETDMTEGVAEEQKAQWKQYIPLTRWGRAEEVADGALYLASGLSSYVTGHVLHITGGLGM